MLRLHLADVELEHQVANSQVSELGHLVGNLLRCAHDERQIEVFAGWRGVARLRSRKAAGVVLLASTGFSIINETMVADVWAVDMTLHYGSP